MALQHDVHSAPSAFFAGPKAFFTEPFTGRVTIAFDLQENIDSFWESIKVNPYMNIQQDVQYVLFYFVAWCVVHVFWQQVVVRAVAALFMSDEPDDDEDEEQEKAKQAAAVANAQKTNGASGLRQRKAGDTLDTTATTTTAAAPVKSAKDTYYNSKLHKYLTAGWKASCYSFLFFSGMYVLSSHSWWNDTTQWFYAWPHYIEPDVLQFICSYLGFYLSETVFLYYEPKLKDRHIMTIHHIATMSLIVLCYVEGFYRFALPVMVIHDVSDPFMEIAKLFHYSSAKIGSIRLADVFFVLFAIVFYISRLFYLPYYIIGSILFISFEVCEYCNGMYIWLVLFGILQVLHIFWAYLIFKMVVHAIVDKGVKKDIRE